MNKILISTIRITFIGMLSTILFSCVNTSKTLKFAIASDFHAPDIPDGKERIQTFINTATQKKVDFIIELGDFCRLDSTSQPHLNIWNSFTGEKYHVIGNHDMDKYTPEEYTKGMGMPGRYYSFDKGDFHFIILDGNNLYDGKKYTHYAKANYYTNPKMQAFVDPEQMEWLKKDLASTNKKCILFTHQSIEKVMGNKEEVRKVLENENKRTGFKKVVLAFSGHNHSNYTEEINGITYIQINSASYVWVGKPTETEKRYPKEINKKYSLLQYSMTYTAPLFAIVKLTKKKAIVKGEKAKFVPPTPKDLNMKDSIGIYPLVSNIKDAIIYF